MYNKVFIIYKGFDCLLFMIHKTYKCVGTIYIRLNLGLNNRENEIIIKIKRN